MFETTKETPISVTGFTHRSEKHGSEEKRACSVEITAEMFPKQVTSLLEASAESILEAFWEGKNHKLRFPRMLHFVTRSEVSFKDKHRITIHDEGERCKRVHKFRLRPLEGGRFQVVFEVQISIPTDKFFNIASNECHEDGGSPVLLEFEGDLVGDTDTSGEE